MFVECPDLTGSLDERRNNSRPISFLVSKDEEELLALKASTSNVAIGVTGHNDEPAGERS